jgi:hypothetical protein
MNPEIPRPNRRSWGKKTFCDQVGNGYGFNGSVAIVSSAFEDASTLELRFCLTVVATTI